MEEKDEGGGVALVEKLVASRCDTDKPGDGVANNGDAKEAPPPPWPGGGDPNVAKGDVNGRDMVPKSSSLKRK
jgi:hypothetical protein